MNMSLQNSDVPKGRAAQIVRALLSARPSDPSDGHLSDEDFAQYASEMLSELEIQPIDAHLAGCPQCCAEMESLLEAAEGWRDLDVKEKIAALRASMRTDLSPFSLMSVALAAVPQEFLSSSVQALLVRWRSWLRTLDEGSLSVRMWKPVSLGGLLAPSTAHPDSDPNHPANLAIDLVLKSPAEFVVFDVPPSFNSNVRVTIRDQRDTSPVLILLERDTGEARVAEALRDTTLPVFRAEFSALNPGSYLVAVSPSPDA
jgi:hypothetical protein